VSDETFPGQRERSIAWLRERGRVPTPWKVIVEAPSWDEAVRRAEQALLDQDCNRVFAYDYHVGTHPDTGKEAWYLSFTADCAEVLPEDYPVRPAKTVIGRMGRRVEISSFQRTPAAADRP